MFAFVNIKIELESSFDFENNKKIGGNNCK